MSAGMRRSLLTGGKAPETAVMFADVESNPAKVWMTSDLVTWTTYNTPSTFYYPHWVPARDKWMLVKNQTGTIHSSDGGANWTTYADVDILVGDNIAMDDNGSRIVSASSSYPSFGVSYSDDGGITWARASGAGFNETTTGLIWSPSHSKWFMTCDKYVFSSSNGLFTDYVTHQYQSSDKGSMRPLQSGGTIFSALTYSADVATEFWKATSLSSWNPTYYTPNPNGTSTTGAVGYSAAAYNGSRAVVAARPSSQAAPYVYTSDDAGSTWTRRGPFWDSSSIVRRIEWSSLLNVFVAAVNVGTGLPQLWKSTNGESWTDVTPSGGVTNKRVSVAAR